MRKVCVVLGSRANYSSIKSAMIAIQQHPNLKLQVVTTASAVLDRYGQVNKLIKKDGFEVDIELHSLIEGETPTTMAKSTGLGLLELPDVFSRLQPDIVVTIGDRFETMSTAIAAAYMNIPLAHTMGGEVSGTIDESIRHAVTKFAHIHFPASPDAHNRIVKLGERSETVHCVGCPRIDLVAEVIAKQGQVSNEELMSIGVGDSVDLREPFLIVSQHPVTTEYGKGKEQILATLRAVSRSKIQAIVLWPNADAGSEDIARGIRAWREQGRDERMHFFKNLPTETYIRLMNQAVCIVGNSSSSIREGAFIGIPAVNIGSRQEGRERGPNVVDVDHVEEEIFQAIMKQSSVAKYPQDTTYGDGKAGKRIADLLSKEKFILQKQITY